MAGDKMKTRRSALARFTACSVPQVLATCLGLFALLSLLRAAGGRGVDSNLWWIDLRALPGAAGHGLLVWSALVLIAFAARPNMSTLRRRASLTTVLVLFVIACVNTFTYWRLLQDGAVLSSFPLPFSTVVAGALLAIAWGIRRHTPHEPGLARGVLAVLTVTAFGLGFPLGQMYAFGRTDYRRPADAIVVLGARVYADGSPSDALADRVRTACLLQTSGLAEKLILSGGPGDGDIHETEGMRRMALELGVPASAIYLDPGGLSTADTVRNTAQMFTELGIEDVLVVSHFYHLPRIKLAYRRLGREVFTVPAEESYTLSAMPYYLAREVAAFWVYWLRPPVG